MKDIFTKYEINQEISNNFILHETETRFFENHFHKKLEMYYILDGKFKIGINDKVFSFTKDEIAFIPEFYSHYGFSENTSTNILLILPNNLTSDICVLLKDKTLPCCMKNKKFNRQIVFPIIDAMKKEQQLGNMDKEIIAKGYLNILIGNLFYQYKTVDFENYKNIEFIVNVLKYIDKNYNEEINLDSIASIFGYNKSYFSRQFNKLVKMNFNKYINYVRLQKFNSFYLSDDKVKITELAFDCGFDSLSTFYRAFSEVFKEKPKQFFKKTL